MKIIQVLTTMSYGDAIGNDVLALRDVIREMGYETGIFAENIDTRLGKEDIKNVTEIKMLSSNDIIIYHFSTGTDLNYKLEKYISKKILIYHNVTPSDYFEMYNYNLQEICEEGIRGIKYLHSKLEYCIADSEFNKQELIKYGFQCKIDTVPILIKFEDYTRQAKQRILNKYNDDWVNFLFVGRIAPNKKQEDIIAAFNYYNRYINKKSRLFLVGSFQGLETYYERLQKYAEKLEANNIIFTGNIKFDEMLAYYKIADIFLCMSEHEGFCVPLVEAMYFDIPIVAYNSTAIGETLGDSGILLNKKNPLEIALLVEHIINNKELKDKIIARQRERLKYFYNDRIKKNVKKLISDYINS